MTRFSVNTHRHEAYSDFKFRVMWDGQVVAGVSSVSGLVRRTEVVKHRSGTDSRTLTSPGVTSYDAVTLERGITHDVAFEQWANLVHDPNASAGAEARLKDIRKDLVLQLMNEAGQVVMAYHLLRCWVSEFQALPELDANGGGVVAIESLTLQVSAWVRDTDVQEPQELGAGD